MPFQQVFAARYRNYFMGVPLYGQIVFFGLVLAAIIGNIFFINYNMTKLTANVVTTQLGEETLVQYPSFRLVLYDIVDKFPGFYLDNITCFTSNAYTPYNCSKWQYNTHYVIENIPIIPNRGNVSLGIVLRVPTYSCLSTVILADTVNITEDLLSGTSKLISCNSGFPGSAMYLEGSSYVHLNGSRYDDLKVKEIPTLRVGCPNVPQPKFCFLFRDEWTIFRFFVTREVALAFTWKEAMSDIFSIINICLNVFGLLFPFVAWRPYRRIFYFSPLYDKVINQPIEQDMDPRPRHVSIAIQ